MGDTCEENDMCPVGAVCSPTTPNGFVSKCVAVSSKELGEACDIESSNTFDLNGRFPLVECDLSKGLICDQTTSTCKQFVPTPTSLNCTGITVH
eukprot:gene16132-19193_t